MSQQQTCAICGLPVRMLFRDIFDDRHGYPRPFSIYCCDQCGFCRTWPSLSREELSRVYHDYYPRSRETAEQVRLTYVKLKDGSSFGNWLRGNGTACYQYLSGGKKVLDVGCGNCLSLLMAQHNGASRVMGIDVDPNILPIARDLDLDVHIGQLSDLPEGEGLFDSILMQQVIEHEPDPRQLLIEARDRLAEHGHVILSCPNVGAFYRHIFGKRWLHWHPPYHINHFSKKSLALLAEQCSFSVSMMKTVTPNDWMTYQLRTLKVWRTPGHRDPFWDPRAPDSRPEASRRNTISRKLRDAFYTYGFLPVTGAANRLLDAAGLGESLVVQLSR